MRRLLALQLVPIALVLLALGSFAACGGGENESLTLEGYFEQLEALDSAFDDRNDDLIERADEGTANASSAAEELDVFVDFFVEATEIADKFVGELDELNGPSEVDAAHREAVESGRAFVGVMENASSGIEIAEDETAAGAVAEGAFTSAEFARFDAACATLQSIADENAIDIDLDCEN